MKPMRIIEQSMKTEKEYGTHKTSYENRRTMYETHRTEDMKII